MIYNNKRSETEIIANILTSAMVDVKKTQLLYKTNISYTHFIRYFNFLIDKQFIEIKNGNPSGKLYHTTKKGEVFLDNINNVLRQIQ